ncbi:hypothetical protein HK096_009560 [Nowakowskiella sp. JEL0078]|nr:hypothetical protein HK096_009560 [Nowakowskiella sp. JEL0078]
MQQESNSITTSTPVHEELYENSDYSYTKRVICIAIDDSKHSEYAFHYLIDNIAQEGDQIVLLNVRPYPVIPSARITGMYIDINFEEKFDDDARSSSHSLLQKYGIQLQKLGISCRAIALRGDAREQIVSKVSEIQASLLVIGSRGLGAFKRNLIGSVSDYVLHHISCAVLVSKIPEA